MMLARIIGTVVSTIQHPALDGRRLLLAQRIGLDGAPLGGTVIAVDTVQAAPGQTVLILDEGSSARQILEAPDAPIRTLIVGIVDSGG
ncbi:MAG: EutN/CcmL family microcompartment protein [Candidatus Eisenbacteria bacterium]|nr:EutN/CcmL family microcompartment protein [Candidatus Eisenbacteria bacterium]